MHDMPLLEASIQVPFWSLYVVSLEKAGMTLSQDPGALLLQELEL